MSIQTTQPRKADEGGPSGPLSIYREYWDFHPEWLAYAREAHQGVGRVELVSDHSPERLAFHRACADAFRRLNVPFHYVKTYLNVQIPEEGEGYAFGYPHTHEPPNATTLVHYLYPGDGSGKLHIFEGDEVVEEITPKEGLTVFMPHCVKHGVTKNTGTEDRICMIATAV